MNAEPATPPATQAPALSDTESDAEEEAPPTQPTPQLLISEPAPTVTKAKRSSKSKSKGKSKHRSGSKRHQTGVANRLTGSGTASKSAAKRSAKKEKKVYDTPTGRKPPKFTQATIYARTARDLQRDERKLKINKKMLNEYFRAIAKEVADERRIDNLKFSSGACKAIRENVIIFLHNLYRESYKIPLSCGVRTLDGIHLTTALGIHKDLNTYK